MIRSYTSAGLGRRLAAHAFCVLLIITCFAAARRPAYANSGKRVAQCDLSLQHTKSAKAACLAVFIRACAPNVHPETLAAIVDVESGAWPYAIHDNDTKRSYFPTTYDDAVALATDLVGRGHSVDLGLGQINSGNLPGLRISIAQVFEPCINLWAADRILSGAWSDAVRYFGTRAAQSHPNTIVLYAISAYNSNSLFASPGYVRNVVAATQDDFVRETVAYALQGVSRLSFLPAPARATRPRAASKLSRPRLVVPFTYAPPGGKP